MKGNLIIVSAPSGAGKTTLVSQVAARDPRVRPSISFTSRPPREGEANGLHYHFVSREEFEAMIVRGELLEWAEVYGNLYGTSRTLVERLREEGFDVILTIDVQGAEIARDLFPDAVGIFILPPSFEAMTGRLNVRGANGQQDLRVRLKNARAEIDERDKYDYLVVNDDLELAVEEIAAILVAERRRMSRCREQASRILNTFIE
ncbi:MAG: guanylate kinase [Blastocatellia bacterium]|nr:guanylate kinase [Blastocatellia bacterium]